MLAVHRGRSLEMDGNIKEGEKKRGGKVSTADKTLFSSLVREIKAVVCTRRRLTIYNVRFLIYVVLYL